MNGEKREKRKKGIVKERKKEKKKEMNRERK